MNVDLTLENNHFEGASENDTNFNQISDAELWLKFQEGSQDAFEVIYAKNVDRLYAYGLKLVSDHDLVKDVIQDLFEEIWDHRKRLGKVKTIRSYLYKSLRRKLIRQASKQRKLLHLVDEDLEIIGEERLSSRENTFEEEEYLNEVSRKLRLALSRLNRKQQEIIHLRFYDGLTVKEIAKITGTKKRTVYHNLAHALKFLKKLGGNLFLLFILSPFYHKTHYSK